MTAPSKESWSLRVLIFKEQTSYIAQCLEYNLVAQGDTIAAVKRAFAGLFAATIRAAERNGIAPLSNLKPAPRHVFEAWESAAHLAERLRFKVSADQPAEAELAIA
jgi:hypothetical protein